MQLVVIWIAYHTQEKRKKRLTKPQKAVRKNAWLGEGYYFWTDEIDAYRWGYSSKCQTGYFEIYKSELDSGNILDTVFNEEYYNFWLAQIEKVAKVIFKKTNSKPTVKEVNDYFKERGIWDEVDGIRFQDLPTKQEYLLVKDFFYRKRIQIVVYNDKIILKFIFHRDSKC